MNTKLTLTIDKDLIGKAKEYAGIQGRSLSDMVESYFKSLTAENEPLEPGPMVKSLRGSFKAPADFDYREELDKALQKKYKK